MPSMNLRKATFVHGEEGEALGTKPCLAPHWDLPDAREVDEASKKPGEMCEMCEDSLINPWIFPLWGWKAASPGWGQRDGDVCSTANPSCH